MGNTGDDGPIAIRDFAEGCSRSSITAWSTSSSSRRAQSPRAAGVREGARDLAESGELPENFDQLGPRDQFLQRRELYARLLDHFKGVKQAGELVGTRPDLQAMKRMNQEGSSLDYQHLGAIPGVEVGDVFHFRSEMFVVGLHRQVQGGIAWIEDEGEKVACSVVISGGYVDDRDHGETVTYTGQGGNDYKGDKRQVEDQVCSVGNTALMNTHARGEVVRVIRGHDGPNATTKRYFYDGLYKVTQCGSKKGKDGHTVYSFDLNRVPGQPVLNLQARELAVREGRPN